MRVLIMGAAGMVGQKLLNRILSGESGIDNSSELYLHDIVPAHVPSGADGCSVLVGNVACLLYTSPSPRDVEESRMPSSA